MACCAVGSEQVASSTALCAVAHRRPSLLLQDCTVLLIYKERACYFPSPYVDAYGERHKQYRGRPLFLDDRRLEALRRLWAQQRIAYEVVHSRSAAKQVIFNGEPWD